MNIDEIKNIVKATLSEERYYHSICVMEMCEKLAIHYNLNVEEAKLIGLTHDIAKEKTAEEMLNYAKQNNIPFDEVEEFSPNLLHAKVGADICKKKFSFSDEMCRAISLHTTGCENMDLLSKILFIADCTGDDRNFPDLEYTRQLAFSDVDKCMLYILDFVINECVTKKKIIHINSIQARNYLMMKK